MSGRPADALPDASGPVGILHPPARSPPFLPPDRQIERPIAAGSSEWQA